MSRGIYEDRVAKRIAHERTSRGWSYQGMSDVVGEFGVPMDKSSIQQVEKGSRRVHVDELIAFANVFRLPIDQLVQDDDIVDTREVRATYKKWQEALRAQARAEAVARGLLSILQRKVAKNPSTVEALEELVREDAAQAFAGQLDGADSGERELDHGDEWLRKVTEGADALRIAWEAEGETNG